MLFFCKFLDKHFLSALHSASRGVENLFKAESHRYCDIFTSIDTSDRIAVCLEGIYSKATVR